MYVVVQSRTSKVHDTAFTCRVTVSGDTFKVTATSSDIGSYAPDCSYPIPKCTAATLLVDPHYCQYEGCTCKKGDTADIRTSADGSLTQYRCIPATPPKVGDLGSLLVVFSRWLIVHACLMIPDQNTMPVLGRKFAAACTLMHICCFLVQAAAGRMKQHLDLVLPVRLPACLPAATV